MCAYIRKRKAAQPGQAEEVTGKSTADRHCFLMALQPNHGFTEGKKQANMTFISQVTTESKMPSRQRV